MKMFGLISCCLLAAMCIMVLTGIKLAEDGIHQMSGLDNNELLHLSSRQEGNPWSVLEYDPYSHDLAAKQNRLEKINAFNLLSYLGDKFSETVSNAVNKFIIHITG